MEGRSLDVMELDAASRTGVDNIRELQEVVSYAPVRDRYKVLIIDEAHMLSKAAFNALLKTLEEPPPRVVFILATTEIQKLLPTILSRCQVFEFHRVPLRSIAGHLRHIADAEGISVSDRTLDLVARAGEGSLRDALSVLERVLAFCGTTVADEDALEVLGAVRTEVLVEFIRGIAARDAAGLLASLDALVGEGHDLVHFWGEFVGVVRDLMLLRAWPDGSEALSRAPDEVKALTDAGGTLSLEDWTRVFQILAGLEHGLKSSSQPRFLFEGALIRMAALGAVRPIEEILAALGGAPPPPSSPRPKREAAPARKSPIVEGFEDVREAIVTAVGQARPMLGAVLERAATIVVDGGSLAVGFGPSDAGMRRVLLGDDNVRSIEQIAAQTLGRPLSLRVSPATDGAPAVSAAAVTAPIAAPGAPRPHQADVEESRQALSERARKDPAVSRLLTEFGAQVVDVRPLRPEASDPGAPPTLEENG